MTQPQTHLRVQYFDKFQKVNTGFLSLSFTPPLLSLSLSLSLSHFVSVTSKPNTTLVHSRFNNEFN